MPDVLLIQPPIRDFYLTAKRTIPYGLACIAAALEARGFTVEILDALATGKTRPAPLPPELADLQAYYGRPDISPFALFHRFRHFGRGFAHIEAEVRRRRPPVVGIAALFSAYADEALAAAEAAKRGDPDCTVVVGGHHPTALPESVLASDHVDFIVRGEGEAAMPELVHRLRHGLDPAAVPGVGFRRPDGRLHIRPPTHLAAAPEIPAPALDRIDHRFYRRGGRGAAAVVASRGCPLACSYCAIGGAAWMRHRRRPVASVLAEIETAVARFGAAFIDFEDENLSGDRRWFMALLEGIVRRFGEGALELRAMNGLLPTTLDPEMIAAMRRAGFTALNLALATTAPAQLARFRRPDVREAFDAALAAAEDNGMTAVGYIIVGAPFAPPQDAVDDLIFLAARRVLAGVSVFYPAPGSRDWELCRALGRLPASLGRLRATALPLDHTTRPVDAVTLLRLGRILNFMKHLHDGGVESRPAPAAAKAPPASPAATRRMAVGRELLAAFFADGRIRGMTPEGEVYAHLQSRPLGARFLERLAAIRLRGVTG